MQQDFLILFTSTTVINLYCYLDFPIRTASDSIEGKVLLTSREKPLQSSVAFLPNK
jgi:hypothetical protein